jgi:hypothetical protein
MKTLAANPGGKGPQVPQLIDPSISKAMQLLHQSLFINTTGGNIEVEILEVEPYVHTQHDSFVDKFLKKDRQPGELMVTWQMGNPQLFYVVSPENQRIVYLRKFRLGNNESTFKAIAASCGLKKEDINALDGQLLTDQSSSVLSIRNRQHDEMVDVLTSKGKGGANSLGMFRKKSNGR